MVSLAEKREDECLLCGFLVSVSDSNSDVYAWRSRQVSFNNIDRLHDRKDICGPQSIGIPVH